MVAQKKNDLDWSRKVAKVVVEALLFPKVIAWAAFDPALKLVAVEIQNCLTQRDYPASGGKENADRAWAEKVACAVVAKLVTAELVTEAESEHAVELAQEEIWINLALDDRPPQQS